MSLDPDLLRGDPAEPLPLETGDPRFQALADQMMAGDYLDAARGAQPLLSAGHYDVRVMGYYLLGLFLEGGPEGLLAALEILNLWLCERWDLLGPERKKERHVAASAGWLFEGVARRLERMAPESPEFAAWTRAEVAPVQAAIEQEIAGLIATLEPRDHSEKPVNLLRRLQAEVGRLEPAHPEPEPVEEEPMEIEVEAPASQEAPATAPARRGEGPVVVEGSHEMAVLLQKIAAFEQLIAAGEYRKAALVSDDLGQIIENFDPRVYLPRVFAGYYRSLSEHIGPLGDAWRERESLRWQVLQELYRVDLDSFVDP